MQTKRSALTDRLDLLGQRYCVIRSVELLATTAKHFLTQSTISVVFLHSLMLLVNRNGIGIDGGGGGCGGSGSGGSNGSSHGNSISNNSSSTTCLNCSTLLYNTQTLDPPSDRI